MYTCSKLIQQQHQKSTTLCKIPIFELAIKNRVQLCERGVEGSQPPRPSYGKIKVVMGNSFTYVRTTTITGSYKQGQIAMYFIHT